MLLLLRKHGCLQSQRQPGALVQRQENAFAKLEASSFTQRERPLVHGGFGCVLSSSVPHFVPLVRKLSALDHDWLNHSRATWPWRVTVPWPG